MGNSMACYATPILSVITSIYTSCNDLQTTAPTSKHKDPKPSAELRKLYKFGKCLGRGAFGTVYEASCLQDCTRVAVKVIQKSSLKTPQHHIYLKRETRALRSLQHPNIVKFINEHQTEHEYALVTELCTGGNLLQYFKRHDGVLSVNFIVNIMIQVVSALAYLHDKGISHRDVKPENILLAWDGTVRLADFGFVRFGSCKGTDRTNQAVGSLPFCTTEQLRGKFHNATKADMWSFGVTLYLLLTCVMPFGYTKEEVLNGHSFENVQKRVGEFPKNTIPALKGLLIGLLKLQEWERLDSAEALAILKAVKDELEEGFPKRSLRKLKKKLKNNRWFGRLCSGRRGTGGSKSFID